MLGMWSPLLSREPHGQQRKEHVERKLERSHGVQAQPFRTGERCVRSCDFKRSLRMDAGVGWEPEVGVRSSLGERWWWLRRVVAGGVGEMIGLGTLEVERARFANRSVLG